MIRKAKISDAEQIQSLIHFWAKQGKVLDRSLNYIYQTIKDFWVYEDKGKIVGCCALGVVGWKNLGEIKSLVILKRFQNKGIGITLVKKCIKEAHSLGIKGIFALTFVPKFFQKLGFKKTSRKKLPHKIWSECMNCVYFPDCKEEAVILKL
ncbi:MAG: N-acetyltransferase [Candidatus Omnitrophota bacterium]|nr:MAG: N-acetyltransferase [Candidatus Omnitrophota bacterium]